MTTNPLNISVVGKLDGRYGISIAAALHVELLQKVCAEVQVCEGPKAVHDIVYHHTAPPMHVPPWYGGKRIIAYWVVESSVAAADFKGIADSCTQIWTSSEASAAAIRALGTQTPVIVIPHPVTVPELQSLPDRSGRDTVTGLYAFTPGWERKNPEGTINAWKKAFPRSNKKARLIVKLRHPGQAAVRLLELLTEGDDRIELITEDVTDVQMKELYARADYFLSGHRAGAFEMHIAEAAAHGLPVVCTAVGGALDYLSESAAFLIPGRAVPPRMEDPLNRAGEWTEPDEARMVDALKTISRSAKLRQQMGAHARNCIAGFLNPESVTRMMRESLEDALELPPSPAVATKARPCRLVKHITCTPALHPVRTGLEYMSGNDAVPPIGTPVVISHRRSGTHLLGQFLTEAFGFPGWLKTHDFPERRPAGHPALYVARNPIDALYESYLWWSKGGGSLNQEVAEVMQSFSFNQWLNGEAGRAFGFLSWRFSDRDNMEVTRGQMYDPMRYWRDHLFAAADAGLSIILFEDLTTEPDKVAGRIADVVKRMSTKGLEPVSEGVGLNPAGDNTIGKAWEQWPGYHLARLQHDLLTPQLMQAIGRPSLQAWLNR